MFRQFTGKEKADSGLDLSAGDGGAFVVMSQAGSFTGDALEDISDERVHDAHCFGRDAGVGVDLLQYLVHVDGVALLPALSPLFPSLGGALRHRFLGTLLGRGLCCFRHVELSLTRLSGE